MNKQLGLLILVTLLAVGAGVWLTHQAQPGNDEPQLLFVDGINKAKDITAIQLKNSQGNLLQAELVDGEWVAKFDEFATNYPLNKTALAEFIQSLLQAKLIEAKTSKSENYHHLGVEGIDNVDSLATLVTINRTNSSQAWQVLIGNKVNSGQGNYVRLPEVAQSWKIDQTVTLPGSKFDWLKRPILNLHSDDISSISRTDNQAWTIVKGQDQSFNLQAIPRGRELRYPGVVSALVNSLIELDFEQLLPLADEQWQKAKIITRLLVKTQSGQQLQVKIANLDNQYFIQFSSEQLQGYWSDWTYQVSSFNAQQLTKTLEDFLAELPKATDDKPQTNEVEEGDSPQ